MKGKLFAKTFFYILRTSEYQVNQDDKDMKIQCNLISKAQSQFVEILSQEREKHMYIHLKLP